MKNLLRKLPATLALCSVLLSASPLLAQAQPYYKPSPYSARGYYYGGTFSQQHPYIQKAAIGGGAGAVLGGLLAPDGYRANGMVKGALIGAGAGMGYQYLRRQGFFNQSRW